MSSPSLLKFEAAAAETKPGQPRHSSYAERRYHGHFAHQIPRTPTHRGIYVDGQTGLCPAQTAGCFGHRHRIMMHPPPFGVRPAGDKPQPPRDIERTPANQMVSVLSRNYQTGAA